MGGAKPHHIKAIQKIVIFIKSSYKTCKEMLKKTHFKCTLLSDQQLKKHCYLTEISTDLLIGPFSFIVIIAPSGQYWELQ